MPPQQPASSGIRWNEVTWYSKLGAIILFLVVVPILCFYIGTQYQAAQDQSVLPPLSETLVQVLDTSVVQSTTTLPKNVQLIASNKYTTCPSYYKDATSVYLDCRSSEADGGCRPAGTRVIQGADPATFSLFDQKTMDCFLSKDAQHVFYDSQSIAGADPTTFSGLGLGLDHDVNSVYYLNNKIGTLNGATATILTDNAYASSFYVKDQTQVYFFDNVADGLDGSLDYKYFSVLGADAPSFVAVENAAGIDAQDSSHSYFKGTVVLR